MKSFASIAVLILLLLSAALGLWPSQDSRSSPASASYANARYGYAVSYPSRYSVEEYTSEHASVGTSTADAFQSVADLDVYLSDASTTQSFASFAEREASLLCDADGPADSISCPSVATSSKLLSASGIAGVKFYLIERSTSASGIAEAQAGPFFAYDISGNDPQAQYAALIVHAPVFSSSTSVVEDIARSVRIDRSQ